MKNLAILLAIVFVGILAWRIGDRLSADALGMATGLILGMLISISTALLISASGRRADAYRGTGPRRPADRPRQLPDQQPTILVPPAEVRRDHAHTLPADTQRLIDW